MDCELYRRVVRTYFLFFSHSERSCFVIQLHQLPFFCLLLHIKCIKGHKLLQTLKKLFIKTLYLSYRKIRDNNSF